MPDIMPPEPPVLRVEDLTVRFRRRGIDVAAVNGVSFALARGETLTILGESGSGKSVSLKALMGLLPDYAHTEGNVWLEGRSVLDMPRGGTGEAARRRDLDDLPGADGGARSGLYHRRADRRDDRAARRHRPRRGDEACAGSARSCEDPLGGAAVEELSARNVGRHAAAGDDRAGARLLALRAAGRRTDHRARCHGADPDPAAAAPVAAGTRHGDRVRHPRCRRRGGDLRPYRGDVCRPLRRDRDRARDHAHAAASLYAGAARLHRAWRAARPRAGDDPGHAAQSRATAARLRLRAALPLRQRSLHARRGAGDLSPTGAMVRCVRAVPVPAQEVSA